MSVVHAAYGMADTNVTISSSQNPSTIGYPIYLSATVMSSNGTVPDNETVTFLDGNTTIGTADTTGGIATLATGSLSLGSHSLMATYSGDANYSASASDVLLQQVEQIATTTTLTSSKNPSLSGQQVVFTATVYPSTATGTISFTVDGTTQPPVMSLSGQAIFNSSLAIGTHTISATYSGDANDTASSSPVITQTVYNGTAQITGLATKCSSISTCYYTITSNNQTGTAYTGYGISFRLPGESNTSTGSYGIQYTTVGGIYHVTGKFTATDGNNGKVVTGSTDTYVRAYGHSGRGGGISYSLVNGTITFNPTNQYSTTVIVSCNPSSLTSGSSATCTSTVTSQSNSINGLAGTVTFTTYNGAGSFNNGGICNLYSGTCSVQFMPGDEAIGTYRVIATYNGDTYDYPSSASTLVYVNSSDN